MEDEEALNRPSIGFPLGLGLLVILLFCMSAFFACCLHWEKLRSLLQSSDQDFNSDIEADIPQSPRKPVPPHKVRFHLPRPSLHASFLDNIFILLSRLRVSKSLTRNKMILRT